MSWNMSGLSIKYCNEAEDVLVIFDDEFFVLVSWQCRLFKWSSDFSSYLLQVHSWGHWNSGTEKKRHISHYNL